MDKPFSAPSLCISVKTGYSIAIHPPLFIQPLPYIIMDTIESQDGTRKLYRRMAFIVDYLKSHSQVTIENLIEGIVGAGLGSGPQGKCSRQSVYRAMNTLMAKYKCPLRYDVPKHSYVLDDQEWEFVAPMILSDSELLALTLGAKFAHDFLPAALADRIEAAVAKTLAGCGASSQSVRRTESFKFLSGWRPDENGDIFLTVFEAWSSRRLLYIDYKDEGGAESKRVIEPQALAFFDMEWNIKAYCHKRDAVRTFLLSRIAGAVMLEETFEPRREIIDSLTYDSFYDFPKIPDVKIRLTERGVQYAKRQILHTRQATEPDAEPGWYILTVPEASLERVVPWVLAQGGDAVPLSPGKLVDEVRRRGRELAKAIGAV